MSQHTRSIISRSNNPAFNLAAEEYLLRHVAEDVHFFYINKPSVIIGKHQNALAEINLSFLEANDIPLYRRLSGGGTVFHDEGNINFCFIKNGETHDLVNFKCATQPIVDVLNSWGIPARSGDRNDLLVNFKKISGNACHVYKRRVMHHGTLLFNSRLDMLTGSLKSDPTRFRDKAVKSVRSQVMNLTEIFNRITSANEFLVELEEAIRQSNNGIIFSDFLESEVMAIEKLSEEKYSTTEWNYSYGPPYEFRKRSVFNGYVFAVQMKVDKGRISHADIKSNHPDASIIKQLINMIEGKYHSKNDLRESIRSCELLNTLNESADELVSLFF
jgi:lipoate---protein ligase